MPDGDHAEWLRLDLTDREAVDDAILTTRPDYVFHLASYVVGRRDLDAVLPTFENNLSTWKKLFSVGGSSKASSSASEPTNARFARAPPCQDYMKLSTLTTVKRVSIGWPQCTSTDQLKEERKSVVVMLSPMKQLIQDTKKSYTDFNNRWKTFKEAQESGQEPSPKLRKVQPSKTPRTSAPVLQAESSSIKDLICVPTPDIDKDLCLNKPVVLEKSNEYAYAQARD